MNPNSPHDPKCPLRLYQLSRESFTPVKTIWSPVGLPWDVVDCTSGRLVKSFRTLPQVCKWISKRRAA